MTRRMGSSRNQLTGWLSQWWPTVAGLTALGAAGAFLWPDARQSLPDGVVVPADVALPDQAALDRAPRVQVPIHEDRPLAPPSSPDRPESEARFRGNEAARTAESSPAPPREELEVERNAPPSPRDVQVALSQVQVELYETSWCKYCRQARAFLQANGVPFRAYDIERDAAANQRSQRLAPGSGVPVVVIQNQAVRGYSPDRMHALLQEAVAQQLAVRRNP